MSDEAETTTVDDDPLAAALEAAIAEAEENKPADDTVEDGDADDKPKEEGEEKPKEAPAKITPEKLKEEKQRLETEQAKLTEMQRKQDAQWKELRSRQDKLKPREDKIRALAESVREVKKQQENDINALLTGDARTILATLTKLTGKDGVEIYREMGESLATNGKRPQDKPPEDKEARERLARLEQERQLQHIQAQNHALIRGVFQELVGEVTTRIDHLPSLKSYVEKHGAEAVSKELLGEMLRAREAGKVHDVNEICILAEHHLRLKGGSDTAGQAPNTEPGPTGAAVAVEEGTIERPGASLSPSSSTATTGKRRKKTAEELERDALSLIPGLIAEFQPRA